MLNKPLKKDKGKTVYVSDRSGPKYAHLPKTALCVQCKVERPSIEFRLKTGRGRGAKPGPAPVRLEDVCKICKPNIRRNRRSDIIRFYKPVKMDKQIVGNLLYSMLIRDKRKLLKQYLETIIASAIRGDVQCMRMIGDVLKDVEVRIPITEQDAPNHTGLIPAEPGDSDSDETQVPTKDIGISHVSQDIMKRLGMIKDEE